MAQSNFHACYRCKQRTVGCHGSCEAYQAEKRENEKQLAEKYKQNKINSVLYDNTVHHNRILKINR